MDIAFHLMVIWNTGLLETSCFCCRVSMFLPMWCRLEGLVSITGQWDDLTLCKETSWTKDLAKDPGWYGDSQYFFLRGPAFIPDGKNKYSFRETCLKGPVVIYMYIVESNSHVFHSIL